MRGWESAPERRIEVVQMTEQQMRRLGPPLWLQIVLPIASGVLGIIAAQILMHLALRP